MNPSAPENAAIPLPAAPEQLPMNPGSAAAGMTAERVPSAERALMPPAAPAAVQPAMPGIPLPVPAQPAAPAPAPGARSAVSATGLVADDGDLIEKEWVLKAKQIVEHTRDDPYKQSEDLTLFKADYMQKRYGKSIKVSR